MRPERVVLLALSLSACKPGSTQETPAVSTAPAPPTAAPAPSTATTGTASPQPAVDGLLARFLAQPDDANLVLEAGKLEFTGLRLAAAASVRAGDERPLAYLRRADGLRDWQVAFPTNARLLAVDLERGAVACPWLFTTGKRIDRRELASSRSGPEPRGVEASAMTTDLRTIDATSLIAGMEPAGAVAFTLLDHDLASNTVVTSYGAGGASSGVDRGQAAALVAGDASRFTAAAGAMTREGVLLAFTADAKAGPIARVSVRVALPAGAQVSGWTAKDRGVPAAVIRAVLVVLLRDDTGPILVDVDLPVFSDRPLTAGTIVEATRTEPLRRLAPALPQGAEAVVYLVSGRHVDGPHRW